MKLTSIIRRMTSGGVSSTRSVVAEAGVADHHVEPAERSSRVRDQALHVSLATSRPSATDSARPPARADLRPPSSSRSARRAPSTTAHPPARELLRAGEPDARRRAGDRRDAAGESHWRHDTVSREPGDLIHAARHRQPSRRHIACQQRASVTFESAFDKSTHGPCHFTAARARRDRLRQPVARARRARAKARSPHAIAAHMRAHRARRRDAGSRARAAAMSSACSKGARRAGR